jgi:tetratricopeptide (TPR) repeat protein/DNA-binding CsgD family transcriptional regulator
LITQIKLGHDSLSTATRLNLATLYVNTGSYPRALALYKEVINRAKKIPDPFMQAIATANTGTIHYHNNDHKNALFYYTASLEYFSKERIGQEKTIASRRAAILNNIGIFYEEAKKYDSAKYFYVEALELAEMENDSVNIANVLNNFGTMYNDQGNLMLALEYYQRALQIREKSNDIMGQVRSNHNLGMFYYNTVYDREKSKAYLLKAVELGKQNGSMRSVASAYELLHKIYFEEGSFEKAYETLLLHRNINDSLFNEENTRKITQLEMQAEFDLKRTEQEVEQKEREWYYVMIGGGLLFLLTVVTLLFFLQRSKTKRSELEQAHLELEKNALKNDLAIKDKELAANIMYLLNKNELINTISEKLLTIKQQVNAESQNAVQKVVLDLQNNLQPELWQEFEFRFQQVHENFYKILNERFPDLTPSERRLCAFLKLDMTTKEISAITHQNAKSIDVARTRLRKKLNLTGTDHNLVTFLAQLDHEAAKQ